MARKHTVTTSDNRVIEFSELDAFDYSEFLLALGPTASQNAEYKQLAQFAYSLDAIDSQLKLRPKTLDQIKANIKALDTTGYNAITQYYTELAAESGDLEDVGSKDQLKN